MLVRDSLRKARSDFLFQLRPIVVIIRSANNAVAVTLPALASVLAFIVYSATGHSLDPANIFASLTLFQLLSMPLILLRK